MHLTEELLPRWHCCIINEIETFTNLVIVESSGTGLLTAIELASDFGDWQITIFI